MHERGNPPGAVKGRVLKVEVLSSDRDDVGATARLCFILGRARHGLVGLRPHRSVSVASMNGDQTLFGACGERWFHSSRAFAATVVFFSTFHF